MNSLKRLDIHLGGLEETHPLDLTEPKTVEAIILLIVATGRLGEVKAEEIFLFEEDSDEELPRAHVLTHAHHGKRVHAHRCQHIKVTFIHVDEKREHAFRPAATIGKLLHWAKTNFPVDQSAKYTLRLTADGEPLPHAAHVGTYVKGHDCSLTLYFAPACRIQG
jgi:hypothetical protein